MDYLKRPIEIEILGLKKSNKPTNSSLCGWQVYVLGIFFLWDGEIKFDLHQTWGSATKNNSTPPTNPPAGDN